jgi:hypothetical protein
MSTVQTRPARLKKVAGKTQKTKSAKELAYEAADRLLQIKTEQDKLKMEADNLMKEHINPYGDSVIDQFKDGKFFIDDVVINIKNNPPKLVNDTKALTKDQRIDLCNRLSAQYKTESPSLTSIRSGLSADKVLRKTLESLGYTIAQDTRYEIKRA